MANRVLSIEIGNSVIKICEMDYKTKKPKMHRNVTVKTPDNAVADGVLQPSSGLAEAVVRGLASNRMRTRRVIFTLTSSKIATREVSIPNVKGSKIESVILANAQEYFPIDLEQYEIGYHLIGKDVVDANGNMRVMALAAPKSLLEGYYLLAQECGLEIECFDYVSNSIYQAVKDNFTEKPAMILKIDETGTMATVMNGGRIVLQRTIAYGVNNAVDAVMKARVYEAYDYSTALRRLRQENCINISMDPEEGSEDDDPRTKEARATITESLNGLISNIGRVMDYYNSRNDGEAVEVVYLTGMGADFNGFNQLLANCLEVRVITLNYIESVSVSKSLRRYGLGEYIACMGAAINPVGFMPKDAAKNTNITVVKGTNYTFVSVAVLALGIVVAGALSFVSVSRYLAAQVEKQALNAKIAELQPLQQIYNDYAAAETQYNKYQAYYQYTRTPNENLVAFINELEEILPGSFYTNSFTSDGAGISMSVTVEGKPAAALTIMNIRNMESIQNVQVSTVKESVNELGESSVTFSIQGTYSPLTQPEEAAQ